MNIQRIDHGGNFGRGVVGVEELELDEAEAGIGKYLALVKWLENRYAKNGVVVDMIGGKPSTFKKLELGFFKRYIKCPKCGETGRMKEPEE